MKKDFLVMSVILFCMAWLCYWMTTNLVMTSSDKDVLQMCMVSSGLVGCFSLGFSLSPLWEKDK